MSTLSDAFLADYDGYIVGARVAGTVYRVKSEDAITAQEAAEACETATAELESLVEEAETAVSEASTAVSDCTSATEACETATEECEAAIETITAAVEVANSYRIDEVVVSIDGSATEGTGTYADNALTLVMPYAGLYSTIDSYYEELLEAINSASF